MNCLLIIAVVELASIYHSSVFKNNNNITTTYQYSNGTASATVEAVAVGAVGKCIQQSITSGVLLI